MNQELKMMNEVLKHKGRIRNRLLALVVAVFVLSATTSAQNSTGRISVGVGLLYENGLDATIAYEWEIKHHNAWEFFANGYLKWDECATCGHICPESFWNNYRSYGFGAAYKPCVSRGRNHHGNLRLGGSLGSDRHHLLGGIHAGYEHSYSLRKGWQVYWQVKTDLMISGRDLFRTGVAIGIKIPTGK